ncbi:MAG: hypothetical protein ABJ327_16490 [Litoreibacter sp.]
MKRFTETVCSEMGLYVYRLIDPRNGDTFYVGKGSNNRIFDHANATLKLDKNDDEDGHSAKLDRIQEIKNAGLEVLHVIHRHAIPEHAIYEVEAALIDAYAGLSNIQTGRGGSDRGPMNVVEIQDKFGLPTVSDPPEEKLILINVNRVKNRLDRSVVLEQVRFAWRIAQARAEKADYVLAVVRGVIIGAFVAQKWLPATRKNFPDHVTAETELPQRNGFIGCIAPEEIWEKFVGERGKRIVIEGMKHNQNPVRYWKI